MPFPWCYSRLKHARWGNVLPGDAQIHRLSGGGRRLWALIYDSNNPLAAEKWRVFSNRTENAFLSSREHVGKSVIHVMQHLLPFIFPNIPRKAILMSGWGKSEVWGVPYRGKTRQLWEHIWATSKEGRLWRNASHRRRHLSCILD